ncbi:MAG: ROK family protein [Bacteroidota bacterium]
MSVIGVDIGATTTKLGLVEVSEGKITQKSSFSTQVFLDATAYLDALEAEIRELAGHAVTGVGVGAPNANFRTGAISRAANLPWKEDFFIRKELEERLKYPVFLDNDANVAALGEWKFGGAKGLTDFMVITLGTGLGSGIVCEGRLLHGHSGLAGELGHLTFGQEKRISGYGREDAAETYLSAGGLVRTYFNLHSKYFPQTPLLSTASEIAEAAKKGDKLAQGSFQLTGERLGRFLAELVVFSSPEVIFLAGGLTQAGELLLKPTRESFFESILPPFAGTVRLELSQLETGEAALLGAAGLVLG